MLTGHRVAWLAAVFAPVVVAASLVPLRSSVDPTNAALLLVVVVVAVAALGWRLPGLCAALSAGLSFDFFLTQPYQTLKIDNRADIETTLILLLVGVAVTELAAWGRRQQAEATRLLGYSEGIQAAVGSVSEDAPLDVMIEQVCAQLATVLQVPDCRFDYGSGVFGGDRPRLRPDGQVEVNGAECDVERYGLPLNHELEILLSSGGHYLGRFVLSPKPGARPALTQRLAAVTLADRAAAALARHRAGGDV